MVRRSSSASESPCCRRCCSGWPPRIMARAGISCERLKSDGKGVAGGRGTLRNALVAAEIAISLVLLLGAGLLMRSFISLIQVDLGFDPRNILLCRSRLPPAITKVPPSGTGFTCSPFSASRRYQASRPPLRGRASPRSVEGILSEIEVPEACRDARDHAGPVFQLKGISGQSACGWSEGGNHRPGRRRGTPEAVVNRTLVASYFGAEDPLGKLIGLTIRSTGPDRPSGHRSRSSGSSTTSRTTASGDPRAAGLSSGRQVGRRSGRAHPPIPSPPSTRSAAKSRGSIAAWLSGSRTRSRRLVQRNATRSRASA